jgi:putative ABC transport system permease protein
LNLQALSLLGLVVGVFLIYNTVMFSVVQRRQVLGIMRSLGTSRRQIFLLVVGEAFILGLIGTLSGLVLGVILGQGTVAAVSQTVSDLYFRINVQTVVIAPETLARGVVVGLVASLGAALIPALDATQTTPAGSMRRSDLEQGATRLIPYLTGLAVAMIAVGLVLLQFDSRYILVSFVALFSAVTGAALLTPLGMLILARLLTPMSAALFGVLGRMAPRALIRSISRTAVAVAALTLAVSVIVGVGAMITSFRTTVVDWLDIILGADVFIATPNASTDSNADLDPALLEAIMAVDGVQSVASVREAKVIAPAFPDLPPVRIVAVDADLSHGEREFVWLQEGVGDYFAALQDGPVVIVTEAFAVHRNLSPTQTEIMLLTDRGPQAFQVIGIYQDYTTDQGNVYMTQAVYRSYWDDPYITSMAASITPGADIQLVMDSIRTGPLAGLDLEVQSNRDLKAGAIEVFDRTFSITVALQLLAIIVAFIGILSSLLALQLEHVREYGIMRANGMTPNQLRRFTLLQTGLMGLIAGVLAMPIGLVLAMILIYVLNVRSFGWTMDLVLTPQAFAQAFAVALIASLVAGLYPAWRVSSIKPAEAVRSE